MTARSKLNALSCLLIPLLSSLTVATSQGGCPDPVAANATGNALWNLPPLSGSTHLSYSVAINVQENANALPQVATNLWIGEPEHTDLYTGDNNYTMCALPVFNLPSATIARGQSDGGFCHQTIGQTCSQVITDRIANYTNSQITGGHWDNINNAATACSNIGAYFLDMLASYIPGVHACNGIFSTNATNSQVYVQSQALTFPNTPKACYSTDYPTLPNYNLRQFYNQSNTLPLKTSTSVLDDAYDAAVRQIYPILSVVMPQINSTVRKDRDPSVFSATATLSCLRVQSFGTGSRISPAYGSLGSESNTGSSTSGHGGLSGGAKAGVAIGVILVVALVAGAIFWIWRGRQMVWRKEVSEERGKHMVGELKEAEHEEEAKRKMRERNQEIELKNRAAVVVKEVESDLKRPGLAATTGKKKEQGIGEEMSLSFAKLV